MREPRSLVFVVTAESTAVNFLRGYLRRLRSHGFDVTAISDSSGGLEQLAAAEGVRAAPIPMRREPHPIADVQALVLLLRVLRRTRPEIIMTATPKASLLGMMAGVLSGVPVRIYQLWGLRCESERGLRRLILELVERATMLLATDIVANSASLADEGQRLAGRKPVGVVGEGSSHGVDLARFSREADMPPLPRRTAAQLQGAELVVGMLGRVHRAKGAITLVDAVRVLAPLRRITVLAVGPSEDSAAETAIESLRDVARVVRVHEVSDPRPYFCAMDIHVLPTTREGFPNVVLEAAALGVPTITTTATGARDSVLHETTGILIPPDDPEALADAICRLADDPALAARFATAARARVEATFEQRRIWDLQAAMIERARSDRARARRRPQDAALT